MDPVTALPLMLFGPIGYMGMGMAVYGRLALTRQDDGQYRGPAWAWPAHLGGMLFVVLAAVMLIVGLIRLVMAL